MLLERSFVSCMINSISHDHVSICFQLTSIICDKYRSSHKIYHMNHKKYLRRRLAIYLLQNTMSMIQTSCCIQIVCTQHYCRDLSVVTMNVFFNLSEFETRILYLSKIWCENVNCTCPYSEVYNWRINRIFNVIEMRMRLKY